MTAKILFVDDDESNLIVYEAVCQGKFEVITALGPESALLRMREHEVGVIVSDQRMPGMTGTELLEKVRFEYPNTVRLLITAYSNTPAAIEAINRGHVRRYLEKPWEPVELETELVQALEWYHTQRRLEQLERRLLQTERVYALDVVATGIAHELEGPITRVQGNVEYSIDQLDVARQRLKESTLDAAELRTRLENIAEALNGARAGAAQVAGIVSNMNESVVQPSIEQSAVDLAEVLRLALRLLASELQRSTRVEVEVSCSPKVNGSSVQLSQVVLNLLANAMHAVANREPSHRVIRVSLDMDTRFAHLEVADSGSRIKGQDRENLFDPFFSMKPGAGTGLGLAISRRIAKDLAGSLDIVDDGNPVGSRFRLSVPLSSAK